MDESTHLRRSFHAADVSRLEREREIVPNERLAGSSRRSRWTLPGGFFGLVSASLRRGRIRHPST
jgi:hypothetical protein